MNSHIPTPERKEESNSALTFGGAGAAPSAIRGALIPGMTLWVPHPFCWEEASKPGDDPEGPYSITFMSWRPGVRAGELQPPEGECDEVADAMGVQLLTIVDIHKPGRFPERVFYTRKWRDPRGREFGKGGLRIKTMAAFKRLAGGWRFPFVVLADGAFAAASKGQAPTSSSKVTI